MATLPELPLENLEFSEIINGNYLYADKTKYISQLLRKIKGEFFLSRPRRFGKTLLLSTLEELFSGDRSLFKGLWIDGSGYDYPRHPVIHLSLSLDRTDPEGLSRQITVLLDGIVAKNGLNVERATPGLYFGDVIMKLSKSRNDARVAVLIDEYDAPVTRRMDDLAVAKGNAQVLADFLSVLKVSSVRKCVRFSLVTGITRYALTSMDSGPNHLVDISLDPRYDGVCGFTTDEFDGLFAGWMKAALPLFKENGHLRPSARVDDLKKQMLQWYDGYNWGGEHRILNPYSILHCLNLGRFDSHWIGSGRPGHLTAMIQANPDHFLEPDLESYSSGQVRKTELRGLQAVPVLFHSGYLTLDKISQTYTKDKKTKSKKVHDEYSFKYPNYEVSSSYNIDCFNAVFGDDTEKDFPTRSKELREAFLTRNADTVSGIFSKYLNAVSYHQRTDQEKHFHSLVQMILVTLDFKVGTEMPGSEGRLDLCVELPGDVYVIIELKFCPLAKRKLSGEMRNEVLANLAIDKLPRKDQNFVLAGLANKKLSDEIVQPILDQRPSGDQRNAELAQAAKKHLPLAEINEVLAMAAESRLPQVELEAALEAVASVDDAVPQEQIEHKLLKAAKQALDDIIDRNYHGIVSYKAKEIIDLGLSIYGFKSKVMALFAPKI